MIIVQLIGGLGNQMFQYATARAMACRNNMVLKLDIMGIEHVKNGTPRKYELGVFNSVQNFATRDEIDKLRNLTKHRFMRLARRIVGREIPFCRSSYVIESQFQFDPSILTLLDSVYMQGYLASEKYFIDAQETILRDFTIKFEPTGFNRELANDILTKEAVSIHIRRGDYITDSKINKFHGTCSSEYYREAVNLIAKSVKQPHFFVFSNDPKWVMENFALNYPVTYVNHNGPEKGYEDLRLMNMCKYHIIANSSFSWWGAWLSQNHGKIVIAPKKWFNDPSINTNDLIPDGWLRL